MECIATRKSTYILSIRYSQVNFNVNGDARCLRD